MSSTKPLDFMPMSDEEGYYLRDPKAVLIRLDAQFRASQPHLLALAEKIEALDVALPAEQKALTAPLKEELQALQGDTQHLLALVRELASYNIKLTAQRQSARAAYNAGWDARYQDILSQLHPDDHRMLRWILEHLDREDDPSLF